MLDDVRRWLELAAAQTARCGYTLHVWTWEDEAGVVHLLRYSQQQPSYIVRCTQRLLGYDVRVVPSHKLPNCTWCVCGLNR